MLTVDELQPRYVPNFLVSIVPRTEGAYPTDLEVDANGYPSEAAIDAVRCIGFAQARKWLLEEFPDLAREMPCAYVVVSDDWDTRTIHFSTGGWSGCEDLIGAMEANFAIRVYLRSWKSGGRYTFVVPTKEAS